MQLSRVIVYISCSEVGFLQWNYVAGMKIMISLFSVCLVSSLSEFYISCNLKAKSTGTALGSISVFIVSQTAIAAFNKLIVWRITCFPNNVQPTSCSFSVYVTCWFLKIFSECFFGQLLLSFFVPPLAFTFFFVFILAELHPSYLCISCIAPSSLPTKHCGSIPLPQKISFKKQSLIFPLEWNTP